MARLELSGGVLSKLEASLPLQELLLRGRVSPALEQTEPPFEILNSLAKLITRHSLGMPVTSKRTWATIADQLVVQGTRQSFAAGNAVNWVQRGRKATDLGALFLEDCPIGERNHFDQLNRILSHHIGLHSQDVFVHQKFGAYQLIEHGLMKPLRGMVDFIGPGEYYLKVTPDWARFASDLKMLDRKITETIETGLQDARIVCVEAKTNGDRLLSSKEAVVAFKRRTTRELVLWFAPAKNLPTNWYKSDDPLPKQKAKAKRWLEANAAYFAKEGRRIAGNDAIDFMCREFSLAKNAAEVVWQSADIPNRGRGGNIGKHEKVFPSELMTLETGHVDAHVGRGTGGTSGISAHFAKAPRVADFLRGVNWGKKPTSDEERREPRRERS